MIEDNLPRLFHTWRQGVLPAVEIVTDLAENPGPPLRRAADHERVCSGTLEYQAGFFRRIDVTIGDDRNPYRQFDRADRIVFDRANVGALPRSAMHR